MFRPLPTLAALALVLGAAACQDSGTTPGSTSDLTLDDGFVSMPLGFGEVNSTFGSVQDSGTVEWRPGFHRNGFHGGGGRGMMCGGLGGFFGASLDFNLRHGLFRGELRGTCAFDATVGRVVCDTVTRAGLIIVRSAAFYDTAGAVQQAFDSTTDAVNVQVAVTGTRIRHDDDTTVVDHASDRTVSGLAAGSTERTFNGTSRGLETTTGSDSAGSFVAVRTLGDTLQGVVVPVGHGPGIYPTAGTVIRSMEVTVTYAGQAPTTRSRREVLTFNGTDTATLVITRNGVTQNCTVQLPHGRPICS